MPLKTHIRAGAGGIYEVDKTSGGSVTPSVPAFGGTSPLAKHPVRTNPQEKVKMISNIFLVVFGGGSIESCDGESLEGVDKTRLTTGTIFTDKLFTGQREMAGLGIYHYQARFYSPKLGRFLSADNIVPGASNPQAWNRYSYVLG
ncbi:MAG: RHS repeat-associated core domain-containing protein [Anaerolineales bacterium]